MILPVIVNMERLDQRKGRDQWDREGSLVHQVVPANAEKPVHRESPDRRGRRVLLDQWGQGENLVHVGRWDLQATRKIVYLQHFRARR